MYGIQRSCRVDLYHSEIRRTRRSDFGGIQKGSSEMRRIGSSETTHLGDTGVGEDIVYTRTKVRSSCGKEGDLRIPGGDVLVFGSARGIEGRNKWIVRSDRRQHWVRGWISSCSSLSKLEGEHTFHQARW